MERYNGCNCKQGPVYARETRYQGYMPVGRQNDSWVIGLRSTLDTTQLPTAGVVC